MGIIIHLAHVHTCNKALAKTETWDVVCH